MIAPASDQVAMKFGITSPTIIAMTTSIFVLAYGESEAYLIIVYDFNIDLTKLLDLYFLDPSVSYTVVLEYYNSPIYSTSVRTPQSH